MRLYNYLDSLACWASAESIHTPIMGAVEADDDTSICEGWNRDESASARILFIVTLAEGPIGLVDNKAWDAHVEEELFTNNNNKNMTFGDIAVPIDNRPVIPLNSSLVDILRIAEARNSEVLLVESEGEIQGSICLDDIVKPPCLIYLSSLALAVEAETTELCSLFPTAIDSLSEESRKDAKLLCLQKKKLRLNEYLEIFRDCGIAPDKDTRRREIIQTTMMSDQEDCEVGLSEPGWG